MHQSMKQNCEANIDRIEERNGQFYNNSWRMLCPALNQDSPFPAANYVNPPTFSIPIFPSSLLLSLRNISSSYHVFPNCPVLLLLLTFSFIALWLKKILCL